MGKKNYFVEGIQGAGKTTMVRKLAEEHPDYTVFKEGDYSPVELAWCAYVDHEEYIKILDKYSTIADEIKDKTVQEGDRKIICYTQILTDVPGFHKDLGQYEIYNGNQSRDSFEQIVLERFRKWSGEGQMFECSIFQNIIENQILFFEMTDDEIVAFYHNLKSAVSGKQYEIVYLEVDDIRAAEEVIRKERSDAQGNELWYPLMVKYLEESPYGKRHHLLGMEGLVEHLEHRVNLEKRILTEVFQEHTIIKKRKVRAENMSEYTLITLREKAELKEAAAEWFHSKWGVPKEAYLECMNAYLNKQTEYGWYLCLDEKKIVAGMGVIDNDFHDRKDLTPNVCAVYTEEEYRCRGIAGKLLKYVVEDCRTKGISPLYLVTDHTGFYERYGWEFLCMVQGDDEPELTRMYIHR